MRSKITPVCSVIGHYASVAKMASRNFKSSSLPFSDQIYFLLRKKSTKSTSLATSTCNSIGIYFYPSTQANYSDYLWHSPCISTCLAGWCGRFQCRTPCRTSSSPGWECLPGWKRETRWRCGWVSGSFPRRPPVRPVRRPADTGTGSASLSARQRDSSCGKSKIWLVLGATML